MTGLRLNERNVRIFMAQQGVKSVEELAEKSGVSAFTVRNLFAGDGFRSRTVEQIAAALMCNPIDLIQTTSDLPPHVDAPAVAVMSA